MPRARMADIDKFTTGFPDSKYQETRLRDSLIESAQAN